MSSLKPFEVVLWVRRSPTADALVSDILRAAVAEPDESTTYDGMTDFHWEFDRADAARALLSTLTPFATRAEVVLLRLSALRDIGSSVTVKDTRHVRH